MSARSSYRPESGVSPAFKIEKRTGSLGPPGRIGDDDADHAAGPGLRPNAFRGQGAYREQGEKLAPVHGRNLPVRAFKSL